jgi:hypothetical protein
MYVVLRCRICFNLVCIVEEKAGVDSRIILNSGCIQHNCYNCHYESFHDLMLLTEERLSEKELEDIDKKRSCK